MAVKTSTAMSCCKLMELALAGREVQHRVEFSVAHEPATTIEFLLKTGHEQNIARKLTNDQMESNTCGISGEIQNTIQAEEMCRKNEVPHEDGQFKGVPSTLQVRGSEEGRGFPAWATRLNK